MTAARADTILITGATGYLGGLVTAALAADRSARLILLIRGKQDPAAVVAHLNNIEASHQLVYADRPGYVPERDGQGTVQSCNPGLTGAEIFVYLEFAA